jgi:predicted Zn-dependent protease
VILFFGYFGFGHSVPRPKASKPYHDSYFPSLDAVRLSGTLGIILRRETMISNKALMLIPLIFLAFFASHAGAAFEDQHDIPALNKALKSQIPSEAIVKAQQLDDQLMQNGELDGTKIYVVTDQRLQRLQNLVAKLLTAIKENDRDWTVRLLDTNPPVVNAFVMGGKYIYVFDGLLSQAASDDELAFVLSHEIGHSYLKHLVRRKDDLTNTLAGLAEVVAAVAAKNSRDKVGAVTQGVRAGYSRLDEEEADAIAVPITMRAGFDPMKGADFFSRGLKEDNLAAEQSKQSFDQARQQVNALTANCIARVQAINGMRASGRNVASQYINETNAVCYQAQQATLTYNSAAMEQNQNQRQQAVAGIYNDHPNNQSRIAAIAALTDYFSGRRSLDSLKQYEQSYRVMAALKQTNSAAIAETEPAKGVTTGKDKQSLLGKTMPDKLKQLKQAFDDGLLTEDEYKKKKAKIIDSY